MGNTPSASDDEGGLQVRCSLSKMSLHSGPGSGASLEFEGSYGKPPAPLVWKDSVSQQAKSWSTMRLKTCGENFVSLWLNGLPDKPHGPIDFILQDTAYRRNKPVPARAVARHSDMLEASSCVATASGHLSKASMTRNTVDTIYSSQYMQILCPEISLRQ
jgi:hypothetical protein